MPDNMELPSHLDCWIPEEVIDNVGYITGVADDRVLHVVFPPALGYREGEYKAEQQHLMALVASAPLLMQTLRHMVRQVSSGGPVDVGPAATLLAKLDALDPTRMAKFPPMTYGERMDMENKNKS